MKNLFAMMMMCSVLMLGGENANAADSMNKDTMKKDVVIIPMFIGRSDLMAYAPQKAGGPKVSIRGGMGAVRRRKTG